MQEDRIAINIELADDVIDSVHILSRRNLQACRIFTDRSAGQVLDLLPLLYHVCGKAHALAARHALAQAAGRQEVVTALELLPMLLETAREHARRILLDWPRLCGEKADTTAMLRVQNKLNAIEAALPEANIAALQKALLELQLALRQDIYGAWQHAADGWTEPAELYDWCERSAHRAASLPRYVLQNRLAELGRSEIQTISLSDMAGPFIENSLAHDNDGLFISQPHWQNQIHETGPLARMQQQPLIKALLAEYGNGLLTRLTASLLEVLRLPAAMLDLLAGKGMSQYLRVVGAGRQAAAAGVEAARGCLWHRVELEQDKVRRYQILAPTEWNFHPQGALALGLRGTPIRDSAALTDKVELMAMAMDPCVACDVSVMNYA